MLWEMKFKAFNIPGSTVGRLKGSKVDGRAQEHPLGQRKDGSRILWYYYSIVNCRCSINVF